MNPGVSPMSKFTGFANFTGRIVGCRQRYGRYAEFSGTRLAYDFSETGFPRPTGGIGPVARCKACISNTLRRFRRKNIPVWLAHAADTVRADLRRLRSAHLVESQLWLPSNDRRCACSQMCLPRQCGADACRARKCRGNFSLCARAMSPADRSCAADLCEARSDRCKLIAHCGEGADAARFTIMVKLGHCLGVELLTSCLRTTFIVHRPARSCTCRNGVASGRPKLITRQRLTRLRETFTAAVTARSFAGSTGAKIHHKSCFETKGFRQQGALPHLFESTRFVWRAGCIPSGHSVVEPFGEEVGATASEIQRRELMRSRSLQLEQVNGEVDGDTLVDRSDADRKHYSRGRATRTPRRRSTRATGANVPLGISARRNRRWTW